MGLGWLLNCTRGGSPDTGGPGLTPVCPLQHVPPTLPHPALGDLPGPPVQRTVQSGQGPCLQSPVHGCGLLRTGVSEATPGSCPVPAPSQTALLCLQKNTEKNELSSGQSGEGAMNACVGSRVSSTWLTVGSWTSRFPPGTHQDTPMQETLETDHPGTALFPALL